MPKLTPASYKILVKIFESLGYVKARQKGSPRPLIIPAHQEVSIGVIQSCLRTAGISRDEYFKLLDKHG